LLELPKCLKEYGTGFVVIVLLKFTSWDIYNLSAGAVLYYGAARADGTWR
jgi:hypothetical protein